MSQPFAHMDHVTGRVRVSRGNWSDSFPVADLPGWIRFYERLAARAGGRFRRSYDADVAALRNVQKALGAQSA